MQMKKQTRRSANVHRKQQQQMRIFSKRRERDTKQKEIWKKNRANICCHDTSNEHKQTNQENEMWSCQYDKLAKPVDNRGREKIVILQDTP